MTLPRWNDPSLNDGGMVLGALWLVQEVGVGGSFTKAALRDAFPRIVQIDRRVRDLRNYDWVLHSSTEDGRLRQDEQRLVRVGVPVWDPVARREASKRGTISAKARAAVLARDDYMCVLCGVAAGDTYPDGGHDTATIGVVRRRLSLNGDAPRDTLITLCKRCSSGMNGNAPLSTEAALKRLAALDETDLGTLAGWMRTGFRASTPLDLAWTSYRRLPADAREAIEALVRKEPR
jgi:hypothetical protein